MKSIFIESKKTTPKKKVYHNTNEKWIFLSFILILVIFYIIIKTFS